MELFRKNKPVITGILNVTPDSFSDGGLFHSAEKAISHAKLIQSEGAAIIDIGADSSRPGSVCCGETEEIKRLGDIIKIVSAFCPVSVDTHHASVAKKAIKDGALYVNDISSGSDPMMFPVIADSAAKIILTYSRCSKPHDFSFNPKGDVIENIRNYFTEKIERALSENIKSEQIILDPGMGAFISQDKNVSWELINRLDELNSFNFPFMTGISRKGFLKSTVEKDINERDLPSAFLAALLVQNTKIDLKYIRVHNVALHRRLFQALSI